MFYHQSRAAVTDGLNQPTPRQWVGVGFADNSRPFGRASPYMSVYMVFQPMRLAIVCVTATRRGLLPRVFTLTSHLTIKGGLFSVALAVTLLTH